MIVDVYDFGWYGYLSAECISGQVIFCRKATEKLAKVGTTKFIVKPRETNL